LSLHLVERLEAKLSPRLVSFLFYASSVCSPYF
jgi:hypothetical protein